jgi:hypothetical protein
MAGLKHHVTPGGRYFVVRGKLWRMSNPNIDPKWRAVLVHELMDARQCVKDAKSAGDQKAEAEAHRAVDKGKQALGERGPVWWKDGAPDLNRQMVKNTPLSAASGTCAERPRFPSVLDGAEGVASDRKPRRETMITKQTILAGCAAIVLSIATAQAGPCNTGGRSAQDAGAGPTPGNTGQTIGTGSANVGEHPPTSTMNRATGDVAASSEDAQRQMQGQPTAAQQAQGAKPSEKMADQGC